MALKTLVKVSKITNLSDARYCAGMGVNLLGFCLDEKDKNFISPEKFQVIIGWLAGIEIVGEFEENDLQEIHKIATHYQLHYIQLGNEQAMQQQQQEKLLSLPIIFKINISEIAWEKMLQLIEKYKNAVAYFLLVTNENMDLEAIKEKLQQVCADFPIILGFGIHKNTIIHLLNELPIKGIELKGSEELQPGLKDYDELAEVLETIEVEE